MKKIDWKKKLTSRKFIIALAGFGVAVVLLFNGSPELADKISAVILAAGSVIGYIIGEAITDAAAVPTEETHKPTEAIDENPTGKHTNGGKEAQDE